MKWSAGDRELWVEGVSNQTQSYLCMIKKAAQRKFPTVDLDLAVKEDEDTVALLENANVSDFFKILQQTESVLQDNVVFDQEQLD